MSRAKPTTKPDAPRLRCALYTRKSSEEGLDQAFNSLHAQREACEAYVLSQAGEGWTALPALYDDGGFSGGSMERPALKQLLADVRAKRIDVVVVYKVDRLTRALSDFAKIVELFDANGVSFVSVTQAFNTTTSMGRLTLNVLLSFAQFEREVTGERIRDKIAASKAKGMWMGGQAPLGYRAHERTLVIEEAAAEQARAIFRRYLELGSVNVLRRELEETGVRTRSGAVFQRGQLYHLLKNRTYLGEIKHRERTYPGLHPPLIDRELFDAVQARLAATVAARGRKPTSTQSALLKGRLFDAAGSPMTPVFTHRGSRIYRYYASAPLQRGEAAAPHADLRRAPAPALDAFVAEQMARITGEGCESPLPRLLRAELRSSTVHLLLRPDPSADITLKTITSRLAAGEQACAEEDFIRVVLPVRFSRRGGRHWLHAPDGRTAEKPRLDPRLVRSLRAAKALRSRMERDEVLISTHHRRLAGLAFAAPTIQSAILNGTQPPGFTLEDLTKICEPLLWSEQVEALRRL